VKHPVVICFLFEIYFKLVAMHNSTTRQTIRP